MKVPYFNDTSKPVTVGGVTIFAGCCRDVEKDSIPNTDTPAAVEPESDESEFDASELLGLSVKELVDVIPDLSIEQLHELKNAEEQDEKPRTTLLEALDSELIDRAL